jgi:AcrR family transcriptional regulator
MKETTRPYRQRSRAAAAEANTERILRAALELFQERPFDQITLAAVAERAGVGVQTVIRRAGTKDGLIRAVRSWVAGQVAESRGAPLSADPAAVAAVLERQYEQWGAVTERTLHQEDVSPALAESAAGGRRAHREWLQAAFAEPLSAAGDRESMLARLIAVCGVEVWLVLRRDGGLSAARTREAVARMIADTIDT